MMLIFLHTACSDKIFTGNVNCDDCYTDKPQNVDLIIEVTLSGEYPEVPIAVYQGNVEDDLVISRDTVQEDNNPYYLLVTPDKRYSVIATYAKTGSVLYAVDGTKPRILKVTDACDSECYVLEDVRLNVRVKKAYLGY